MFLSSSWNIKSFSWVSIHDYARIVESTASVNGNNVEKLIGGIGIKLFVSEDTFKTYSFITFWWSLEEEAVTCFFHFEELISTLFAKPQFNLIPFLIPNIVRLTVDNFILIFSWANFLDHPKLSEVMLIGLSANNSCFIVFSVVVGGYSECLIAIIADNLIDISSGEG